MPGKVGDYTIAELQGMPDQELKAAEARSFRKLPEEPHPAGGLNLGNSVPPPPVLSAPEPRDDVWASAASQPREYVCPSGQRCLLRKVTPEQLMKIGMLDRVTRLEGLASDLVSRAEGQPPKVDKLPSHEDFQMLLDTINSVVPLAVVQPKLYQDDDASAPEGAIRVGQVDLNDRMAILEEALRGVRMLDAFRNPR